MITSAPSLPVKQSLSLAQYKEQEQARNAIAKRLAPRISSAFIDKVIQSRRVYDEAKRVYDAAVERAADEVFRI